MKTISKWIGLISLAGTILPSALFMFHAVPLESVKLTMLLSAIAWFVAAPFWMKAE